MNQRLYRIAALVCTTSLTSTLFAQSHTERLTPLPAFGRSLVGNADSTAMVQNPANLAFLPGSEFRFMSAFADEDTPLSTQGSSVAFATPLGFLPISTGLRFDMLRPTELAAENMLGRNFDYQWLTWSLAWGSKSASFGFSYQTSYSDVAAYHGFGSWTLGLNLRPSDYIGLAAVGRNLNEPESDAGLILAPAYEGGIAIRPTGTDAVEVGLEAAFIDEVDGYWVPRATLDVAIPTLGRIRGDVEWIDPTENVGSPSWVASTSLVVVGNSRQGSGELSGGIRYGDAHGPYGDDNRAYNNLHAEAAFRGFRGSSAAENMQYAVRLRLEDTPGAREHVSLLRKMWSFAEEEPNLRAVLLELRTSPAKSLAHAQELQDAIYYLRQKGKLVLCHLESATGAGLYVCSAASQTLIHPAGGIRYQGLSSESLYLKGLLDKVGVRADFVRIGEHKSAPEQLARREGSETAVSDRADLLQQVELEVSGGISRARELSIDEFRASVDKGPFTAAEAKESGLVDGFAFDDMLEDETEQLAKQELVFEKGSRAPEVPTRFGPTKRIAIVYVDGEMVDGRSQFYPILNLQTTGSYTIAETLRKLRKDPSVGAVVLRVESGGGSAMAADVIWREVALTKKEKPVVVSMGAAAASGGYYISAPGSYIYANPLTITGSIGIFYGKLDIAGLLGKIGVNVETLRTSAHADAESPFRPFTDEERERLAEKIEQFYALFLQRVSDGRDMSKQEVDAVARGRVWTGRQAKEHGLVDGLGGLRQALAKARVLAGLRDDVPIVELPERKTSLLGKMLGVEGIREELRGGAKAPLPPELMNAARTIAPYALYPADQPLSRIDVLPRFVD